MTIAIVRPRPRLRRDYRCAGCGYGIRVAVCPSRCPMCGERDGWTLAGARLG